MKLFKLNLKLFDGGAAGVGAASGVEGASNGVSGQEVQVVYGKQAQPDGGEPGETDKGEDKGKPEGEKKTTLKDILKSNPDLKPEIERMMQNRIKNAKAELDNVSKQMQSYDPILTTLYARYGVEEGNLEQLQAALQKDTSYLEEEAELKGLTVEQLAYMKQLEMKSMMAEKQKQISQAELYKQQLQTRWQAESEQVKALYPDFDFAAEIGSNETFEKLIRANFPVKDAYEFAHKDEITQAQQASVAAETQKQVVSNIKARQERPTEAGLKGQQGFQVKSDPSQFSSKDIKEIRKRVQAGEKISF